jgi:hypothetical protein
VASWDVYEAGREPPAVSRPEELTNDDWVELGNRNVAAGGSVWPQVSEYYLQWKKER